MTEGSRRLAGPVARWLAETCTARPSPCLDEGSDPVPAVILENETLRTESVRYTVQLLVAERCSRSAAAGLLNAVPVEGARQLLATQVLDEARHVEAFTNRLSALGVAPGDLDESVYRHTNPDLVGIADAVLEQVGEGDYVVGIVAQNIILDEVLLTVYEMLSETWSRLDPAFSTLLRRIISDENRHVEFGRAELQELVGRNPDKKTEIAGVYREIGGLLMHTFDEALLDNPIVDELRKLRVDGLPEAREPASWRGIDLVEKGGAVLERELIAIVSERIESKLAGLGVDVARLGRARRSR